MRSWSNSQVARDVSEYAIGSQLPQVPHTWNPVFRANGSVWYRVTYEQRRGWRSTTSTNAALFIQDSWSVAPALTIDLGLRLETLVEETPQGFRGLDHGLGDRIAPRFGFAWAIGGSVVRGSWGRFFDTIGNQVTRTFVDAPDLIRDVYLWDSENEEWSFFRRDTIGAAHATLEELDAPYMDEITLGYEGRITGTLAWSVTGIYREWRHGIEDDDGQFFPDFPDNPPADGNRHYTNLGRFREYRGLELTLRRMLGRDNLQLLASYTWSETLSLWGDTDYFSVHANNPFRYHNYWGRPEYAPDHMLKLNGSYLLPLGFVLGGNVYWWSGNPYTITAEVETSEDSQWGERNFGGYYLEKRGSRELDPLWRMDLRVEKSFKLTGDLVLSAYVDVFNVFDNQEPVSVNSHYGVVRINEPGQTVDNDGVPIDSSSFEPVPDEWQAPRSYFFGVKLEF